MEHFFPVNDQENPYYTPGLVECVEALPPLIGCEAAYLFPTDVDICLSKSGDDDDGEHDLEGGVEDGTTDGQESAGNLVMHVRSGDIFFAAYAHKGQVGTGVSCRYCPYTDLSLSPWLARRT